MNREALLGGAALPAPARPPSIQPVATGPAAPLVAICVPSDDDWKADMAQSYAHLASFTASNRIARISLCNMKASMITMARNELAQQALNMKADYALYIDSDMKFPGDALGRLLRHNKDIVAATYNKRVPPFETLGRIKHRPGMNADDMKRGGLWEADYLPGGFMLIKTDVFRKLEWPWFFETINRLGEPMDAFMKMMHESFMLTPTAALEKSLRENAELQRWLADGWPLEPGNRIMSEDFNFCRKARKAGYEIWCDVSLTWEMVHIGQHDVTCVPGDPKTSDAANAPATKRPPAIVTV